MKGRCETPSSGSYANYGARGVRVAPEWQDYPAFRDWSLTNGYAADLTIDRIDTDGDYTPANCRWATMAEQNNNKRNTVRAPDGRPAHVVAAEHGVSHHLVLERLNKGWPIERAMTEPVSEQHSRAARARKASSRAADEVAQ